MWTMLLHTLFLLLLGHYFEAAASNLSTKKPSQDSPTLTQREYKFALEVEKSVPDLLNDLRRILTGYANQLEPLKTSEPNATSYFIIECTGLLALDEILHFKKIEWKSLVWSDIQRVFRGAFPSPKDMEKATLRHQDLMLALKDAAVQKKIVNVLQTNYRSSKTTSGNAIQAIIKIVDDWKKGKDPNLTKPSATETKVKEKPKKSDTKLALTILAIGCILCALSLVGVAYIYITSSKGAETNEVV